MSRLSAHRVTLGRGVVVLLVALGSLSVQGPIAGPALATPSLPTTVVYDGPTATVTGHTSPHIMIANGLPVVLRGTLTSSGLPVVGRALTFTVGTGSSSQSCTGVTNDLGGASCTIASVDQPLGPLTPVSVAFAGDSQYAGTLSSAVALVYAFPAGGGAFVVGDLSTVPTRTFWGDGWSALNPLSGGSSSSGFLGFARKPTTPACGSDWSAAAVQRRGSPLPEYMGVIVTDSITSSGQMFGGSTAGIIVVRTDRYAPVASQPGEGIYVARVC